MNRRKRGGQPGNKNAIGHGAPKKNRNAVGHGAPLGNKNAYKFGIYERLWPRYRSEKEYRDQAVARQDARSFLHRRVLIEYLEQAGYQINDLQCLSDIDLELLLGDVVCNQCMQPNVQL